MLKRIIALFICIAGIAALTACGSEKSAETRQKTDSDEQKTAQEAVASTEDEPQETAIINYAMYYPEFGIALTEYPELKTIEGTNALVDVANRDFGTKTVLVYACVYDTTKAIEEAGGLIYAFAVVGMEGDVDAESARYIVEGTGLDFSDFEEIAKNDGHNAFVTISCNPIESREPDDAIYTAAENLKPETVKVFKRIVNIERPAGTDKFNFTGVLLDGAEISSEELFGRADYTIINFWATWCGPCVGELQELQKVNDKLADRNAQIILVCCDAIPNSDDTANAAIKLLDSKGVSLTCLRFTTELEDQTAIYAYPTSYIVDKNGNVLCDGMEGAMSTEQYIEWFDSVV